jgi:type I restriction enzyme S subunit
MQVGRDETIRLALYTDDKPAIISPAYLVIESKDENELIPEYMMMWLQRPESDRYGWFIIYLPVLIILGALFFVSSLV